MARGALPENIRIVSVVVAPPAMRKLSEKYKGGRARNVTWERGLSTGGGHWSSSTTCLLAALTLSG